MSRVATGGIAKAPAGASLEAGVIGQCRRHRSKRRGPAESLPRTACMMRRRQRSSRRSRRWREGHAPSPRRTWLAGTRRGDTSRTGGPSLRARTLRRWSGMLAERAALALYDGSRLDGKALSRHDLIWQTADLLDRRRVRAHARCSGRRCRGSGRRGTARATPRCEVAALVRKGSSFPDQRHRPASHRASDATVCKSRRRSRAPDGTSILEGEFWLQPVMGERGDPPAEGVVSPRAQLHPVAR